MRAPLPHDEGTGASVVHEHASGGRAQVVAERRPAGPRRANPMPCGGASGEPGVNSLQSEVVDRRVAPDLLLSEGSGVDEKAS